MSRQTIRTNMYVEIRMRLYVKENMSDHREQRRGAERRGEERVKRRNSAAISPASQPQDIMLLPIAKHAAVLPVTAFLGSDTSTFLHSVSVPR